MQEKLLLFTFHLNGGLHAVSIENRWNWTDVKFLGRFGFLKTGSELNFVFRTSLQAFKVDCLSFQANTCTGIWKLTGNVLPVSGTKFQSSGRHRCVCYLYETRCIIGFTTGSVVCLTICTRLIKIVEKCKDAYFYGSLLLGNAWNQPVSGINCVIHSVSLASHVSTHLLIHLSAHLCHHHHSRHPSLLHSFTPSSKPAFSTNPSHLYTPSTLDCLHDNGTGPDLSCFSI